jgi:hypothetical protein
VRSEGELRGGREEARRLIYRRGEEERGVGVFHGCYEWRPSMVGNGGIQASLMPKTNGRLRGRRLGLLGRGRARSSTASVGRCRGAGWPVAASWARGFGCRGWASGGSGSLQAALGSMGAVGAAGRGRVLGPRRVTVGRGLAGALGRRRTRRAGARQGERRWPGGAAWK